MLKIIINIVEQKLYLLESSDANLPHTAEQNKLKIKRTFMVSTAKNGVGNIEGSGCTPLGYHIIAEKFGEGAPKNSVFVGRVATGEHYSDELAQHYPNRDWILSRILWLAGVQEGVNKGKNASGVCDTYQRYIYIHGTPDSEPMEIPLSHGCIRMRNDDIIWLFDHVNIGTSVEIIHPNLK